MGVTGYRVYRGGTQVGTTTSTGYTDTGLTPATAYSYTVKAYDAAGNLIQLWTYGGGTNEQWKPVAHTSGTYTFTPRNNTNECLDVTNVSTADGAPMQQWTRSGGTAQSFTLSAQS